VNVNGSGHTHAGIGVDPGHSHGFEDSHDTVLKEATGGGRCRGVAGVMHTLLSKCRLQKLASSPRTAPTRRVSPLR
jgi:hypothetical protein